jgi:hypothetical protein
MKSVLFIILWAMMIQGCDKAPPIMTRAEVVAAISECTEAGMDYDIYNVYKGSPLSTVRSNLGPVRVDCVPK